jgi:two-component system copper resistance phosphate regulon response regulator CusR
MRILVVEDDHSLRASIARGLREASCLVDEASTGDEGLSLAEKGAYDAVVLDILLPGMDGVQVCRELRARENWVPILILTALDAVEQRITGLNAGADDYLGKPFDFGELVARLRALTRRRGQEVPPGIRLGDLHIDTRRRSVRRGRRAIDLTAREFDFLLCLARNAGRVVTRPELLSEVWEDPHHTHSNVIDVYASRLRRKIDEGETVPMIATSRGVGYMIDVPPVAPRSGKDSGRSPGGG